MTATAPGDQAAPLLEVRDVAVHYGGIKAVDGITLDMYPGKIYGIIGPNGSGKSTLLAALTRLVQLTRGEITYAGRDLRRTRASSLAGLGIARTFQTVRLMPGRTVRQNVQLGADVRSEPFRKRLTGLGSGPRSASSSVADAISRTGLAGLDDFRPDELSYGTQRRIEIARAMATEPRLLLLDEPTAGMNGAERLEISQLMRRLSAEGLTQLLVEHDVQMMIDTCDHVFAMAAGIVIAEGAPRDVVRDERVREAYLGTRWHEHA
jgi:branched-chain amino acid transport system ATP-binding protein